MFDISKEILEYLSQVQSRLSEKCQSLFFSLAWCQWGFSGDLLHVFVLRGPLCSECSWLSPDMKISSLGTAYCRNVEPFTSHNLIHETLSPWRTDSQLPPIPGMMETTRHGVLCRENIHTVHSLALYSDHFLACSGAYKMKARAVATSITLFSTAWFSSGKATKPSIWFGLGLNLLFLSHCCVCLPG